MTELNPTLKDLAMRQNRAITSAQQHDFENTKRYIEKDLDDFIKSVKDKSFILNTFNSEKALWNYEQHKLCKVLSGNKSLTFNTEQLTRVTKEKTNDINDIVITSKTNKSTITQMQLLDIKREQNPQRIKIKYPAGLLDEFIQEYQKIIKWLEDNHFDVLTLLGSNNEIHISQHEFEVAIHFLEKMKLVSEEK